MYTEQNLLVALQADDIKQLKEIAGQGGILCGQENALTRGFFEQVEIMYRSRQFAADKLRAIFSFNFWHKERHSHKNLFYIDRKAALSLLQELWEQDIIASEDIISFLQQELNDGITFISSFVKLKPNDLEGFEKILTLLERIFAKHPAMANTILKLLSLAQPYRKVVDKFYYMDIHEVLTMHSTGKCCHRINQKKITKKIDRNDKRNSVLESIFKKDNGELASRLLSFLIKLCESEFVSENDIVNAFIVDRVVAKPSFILHIAKYSNILLRECIALLNRLFSSKKVSAENIVKITDIKKESVYNFVFLTTEWGWCDELYAKELITLIGILHQTGAMDSSRVIYWFNLGLSTHEKVDVLGEKIYAACKRQAIDVDAAIYILEKIFDQSPRVCFLLADCYGLKQDENGRLKSYDKIPTLEPTLTGEDHCHLSRFYGSLNQPEKSSAHLQLAKRLGVKEQPFEFVDSQYNINNPSQIAPSHIAIWSNENNVTRQDAVIENGCNTDKPQSQNSM